jgi:hypothetical protein
MIGSAITRFEDPFSTHRLPQIVHELHALAQRVVRQIIVSSPASMPSADAREPPAHTHELVVRGFIRVRSPIAILRAPRRPLAPDLGLGARPADAKREPDRRA